MAQKERQAEQKADSRRGTSRRKATQSGLVSWKPLAADLDGLTRLFSNPNELADRALEVLERGIALSLKRNNNGHAFFCIARSENAVFGEGVSLSFWNSCPVKAFVMAIYALDCVYPDYPDVDPQPALTEDLF